MGGSAGGIVAGVVGAAIGAPFGMAGLGFSIGSGLYNALNQPDQAKTQAPLMDLRFPGTEYGEPLPWLRGAMRIAPQYWWNTNRVPHENESGGGGGGGKGSAPEPEQEVVITYTIDVLYGLTANQIIGVARKWDAGDLIWSSDSAASAGTIIASNSAEHWSRFTVYTGADDQLPDPDYEAAIDTEVAVDSAPAYRQRGSVFLKDLQLGRSGAPRQLTYEVVADGEQGPQLTYYDQDKSSDIAAESEECASVFILSTSEVWSIDAGHNGASAPKQIAIFNTEDDTTEFVEMPAGFVNASSTYTFRITYLEGQDVVLIAVRETGSGNPDVLAFRVSDRAYIGNWQPIATAQLELLGVDDLNGTVFVRNNNIGKSQIWDIVDGLITISTLTSTGGSGRAFPTTEGTYYTVIRNPSGQVWKHSALGSTFFATDADDADASPGAYDEFTFDTQRQRLYYWSLSQLKLKYVNCADDTIGTVGTYDGKSKIFYEPFSDKIYAVSGGTSPGPAGVFYVRVIEPDDGTYDQYDIPATGGAHFHAPTITAGIIWGSSLDWEGVAGRSGLGELILNVLAKACPSVESVQSQLCLRAGLTAGQIDVSPLSTITREVCCLPWSQVTPAREPSERLMGCYFYECTLSGRKIKFVPRGGSAVTTIPYADLNASVGGSDADPFPLRKNNDIELPAHKVIKFINISNDYENGSEKSDRLISATSQSVEVAEIQLGMTPSEAKAVADTHSLDQAASIAGATINVMRLDYPTLEPTDPILVTAEDGSLIRMRIVEMTEAFPLLTLRLVIDDTSVLTSQGITSTDYNSQTVVAMPANSLLQLGDWPMLNESDNEAGLYAASKSNQTNWPGAAILDSANDVDYVRKATILQSAIYGTCSTTLGDWTGPRVFDCKNSVRVNVGSTATLSSTTRAAVLADQSVNAFMIGSEFIQAIDCDLVSPGVYDLRRLLRGGRGTEWAMVDHAAAERCTLIREAGIRSVVMTNAQLGVSRFYKAVTLGRSAGTAPSQTFTNTGIRLKPFSPVRARVSRDGSNNATITWEDRSRFAVRMVGTLGISVPPDETVESWSIDFYTDDTFTTVAATKTASTTSYTFTAADQTTAGLMPGDDLCMKIHKVSAVVGRGYPLQRVE